MLLTSCNSTYRLRYWNKTLIKVLMSNMISGCNSTYRLRYWNIAPLWLWTAIFIVATVPTACGIETHVHHWYQLRQLTSCCNSTYRLRYWNSMIWPIILGAIIKVATVPTACGIETIQLRYLWYHLRLIRCNSTYRLRYWNILPLALNIPVSTSCNSTYRLRYWNATNSSLLSLIWLVATVPTACGIETNQCQGPFLKLI